MGSWTEAALQWREGKQDAQYELQERMRPFLIELLGYVRRHRPSGLKARIESEGVVQAAFKSFLSGIPKREFPELPNREAMQRTLTHLVKRVLSDEVRKHTRHKNNACKEVGPEPLAAAEAPALASQAEVSEWLEEMSVKLRGVHEKAMDIVELLLQGYTTAECAQELNLGLRTTQQIRKQMRELWHGERAGDESVGDAGEP